MMRESEASVAAQLQAHERPASGIDRAAETAVDALRREFVRQMEQLTAAREHAAQSGHAERLETGLPGVRQALDGIGQQVGLLQQMTEAPGTRLAVAEEGIAELRGQFATFQDGVSAGIQSFDRKVGQQAAAIDSARSALEQTDDVVDRVVEALELLQSSVPDQVDGNSPAVN